MTPGCHKTVPNLLEKNTCLGQCVAVRQRLCLTPKFTYYVVIYETVAWADVAGFVWFVYSFLKLQQLPRLGHNGSVQYWQTHNKLTMASQPLNYFLHAVN